MCGIAGGVDISRATVENMCALQSSRGPDNTGIEEIGGVIFGHNRLAIVDKSADSNQPVRTRPIVSMLTYNGEIYNINPSPSDTINLAYALFRWNDGPEKLCNSLNGMFAFGYFDGENIHLVRDRFGIKPLYYYHSGNTFAFASTPAAVRIAQEAAGIPLTVSKKGVQEYLSLGATMLHSMFEGIEAVPPGHYLTYSVKTNSVQIKRWYYPKYVENAKEKIKGLVEKAIDRVKLTCDWPQIILLSGGIDSSLVASRYGGQGISAIHLTGNSDEEQATKFVADKFNIKTHYADPSKYSAEEGLRDFITKSGEPTMAGLIPWITCKEIAKQGYRVAITANGADELFFGYDRMSGTMQDQIAHIMRPFFHRNEPVFYWHDERHPLSSARQWFEISTYLMFDLNKTLDFASMCHSVEVRVPYLDHELVECALSIAQDVHVGRYGNKTILKEMLRELGFEWDFIHRPKVGFSLHNEPPDWQSLQTKAMEWYKTTDYEQLPARATGRQESYHQSTVAGLYLWHQIFTP
jgi:asparagine synthase (glutamine-hydrolysing)